MFACITEVRSWDPYNVIIVKVVTDISYFFFSSLRFDHADIQQQFQDSVLEIKLDLSRIPLQWAKSSVDNSIQMIVFCPPKPRICAFVYRNAGKVHTILRIV